MSSPTRVLVAGPNQPDMFSIPAYRVIDEIVYYMVTITTESKQWTVIKRYSHFEALAILLAAKYGQKGFPPGGKLPPKAPKMLITHTDRAFVEERRVTLQHFLRVMNSIPVVAESDTLRDFISHDISPEVYVDAPFDASEMPDDAEVTDVTIPSTRLMSDHVLYQIDVMNMRLRKSFQKWTVLKRYSQFAAMDVSLRQDLQQRLSTTELADLPTLPSQHFKYLVNHMDEDFIEQRRVLLENYLQRLIRTPYAARSPILLHFLGVSA